MKTKFTIVNSIFVIFLLIIFSCSKNYDSVKDISHLKFLKINENVTEMQLSYYLDELDNKIYIPKEKISRNTFNYEIKDFKIYPNQEYTLLPKELIVDGKLLKHLLISSIEEGTDYKYKFDVAGNIAKIEVKGKAFLACNYNYKYDGNNNIIEVMLNYEDRNQYKHFSQFEYDSNNLLTSSKLIISTKGIEESKIITTYNYEFLNNNKLKIKYKITRTGIINEIKNGEFEMENIGLNLLTIKNLNYQIKFNETTLLSYEEFKNNNIETFIKNKYENNQLTEKEIKFLNSYAKYNLTYDQNSFITLMISDGTGQKKFNIEENLDAKGNWTTFKISNTSAFTQYEFYLNKLNELERNKYLMDQFYYEFRRESLNSQLQLAKLLLSQIRCERMLSYK